MRGSRNRRGITLIELMVAGALFGLFTGMVAGALMMAQRAQDQSVAKLDAIRHASLAEDLLARDIEAARFSTEVTMDNLPLPTTAQRPLWDHPLMIRRWRMDPTGTDPDWTEAVIAIYWFEPNPDEPTTVTTTSARPTLPGRVRRTLFDTSLNPVPGETAAGRVLVRDAKDFQVMTEGSGAITLTKADIWVSTVGYPVTTYVATEIPPGIN